MVIGNLSNGLLAMLLMKLALNDVFHAASSKKIYEYVVVITIKYPYWSLGPPDTWGGRVEAVQDTKLGEQTYKVYTVAFNDQSRARQFASEAGAAEDVRSVHLNLGKPKATIEWPTLTDLDYDMLAATGMSRTPKIKSIEPTGKAAKRKEEIKKKRVGGYEVHRIRTESGCSIRLFRVTKMGNLMRIGTWSGTDRYECDAKFDEIISELT